MLQKRMLPEQPRSPAAQLDTSVDKGRCIINKASVSKLTQFVLYALHFIYLAPNKRELGALSKHVLLVLQTKNNENA